jgi:glycosyltransferase involved in cell wall biosynthesis
MKILYIQETNWIKRNPIDQHHIAELLNLRGHDFRVIDFNITWRMDQNHGLWAGRQVFHNISKIYNDARITVIRPGIIRLPLLDYLSLAISQNHEIHRQIREYNPDVIIGLGGIYSYLAGRAARRHHIPFLGFWVDIHHRLVNSPILQFVGWIIEHRTVKLVDKLIVVNENLKGYVVNLGAPKEKVVLLSTGVDISHFNPSISGDAIRNSLGIRKNDIVLLFVGWLYHFSGLKEIARELARINSERIKIIILGEGDAYNDLVRIQQENKLTSQLILTGKKQYSEIPNYIASADICILPAYPTEKIMRDIVPIKLYEYAAMKKPTITTRLPGVMKRFGNENGVIYVEKPEDTILKALELTDKHVLDDIGSKARIFAEKNSWDKITDIFENILQEMIKEKSNERLRE